MKAKKKQQHTEDDSAKENKVDETLVDSNEDPDQIIQNISKKNEMLRPKMNGHRKMKIEGKDILNLQKKKEKRPEGK